MGTVEIPTPLRRLRPYLQCKYAGRLELIKSKEESIRSIIQYLSLFYQIYFPTQNPIPVVISITLNDIQYCSGQPVARCLRKSNENIPSNMLLISLGRSNLRNWKEPDSINVQIIDYKFHTDYKNSQNADYDLAIIKLMEHIKYTPSIRPVCLWMEKVEFNNIVGEFGYIAGWGYDGKSNCYSAEPRISKVSIVSQEDCLRSSVRFIEVTSNKTFCTRRRDDTGSYNGDIGSGLAMFHTRYRRYHLRGIISFSLIDIKAKPCDLHEYIFYVDIAKYLSWIQKEIIS